MNTITTAKQLKAELDKIFVKAKAKDATSLTLIYSNSTTIVEHSTMSHDEVYAAAVELRDRCVAEQRASAQREMERRRQAEAEKIAARKKSVADSIEARATLARRAKDIVAKQSDSSDKARYFFNGMADRLLESQKLLEKFSDELMISPANAMEWSQNMFELTAKISLAQDILRRLVAVAEAGQTSEVTLDALYDAIKVDCTEQALRLARSTSSSSMATSNLHEQAMISAHSTVASRDYF